MKAYLKQARISPKKVNVVASLVRGKKVSEALTMLKFTPKRSAPVLAKLIASAAANAENNFKQDKEKLQISKIIVDAGMTLKRGNPISRGRWHPILKRSSRISVELSPIIEEKVESKVKKVVEKKEVKKSGLVKDLKKSDEPKVEKEIKKNEVEKVELKKELKVENSRDNNSKK
ncbi:50S ribosomal protein L22 [Candidatus Gracilibacteria bacterium]|nr:50S ribosomal protein L22 [Candidatus Gracilibacteria bacterium]MCF7856618.1 50S ribosomal protein L22 [Candidatus Gracilibacteria bacterium]MCF7896918.1 50S ribosomal protein L22 [Candidatus Gracilibacteria bacterium]